MLTNITGLKKVLQEIICCKAAQGHEVAGLQRELEKLPDSFDAVAEFSQKLEKLSLKADWPYIEPDLLEEILAQCDSDRPTGIIGNITSQKAQEKARAAFLAAVAGCILGKPLEIDPTLHEIRTAAEKLDQWPIDDYITEELLEEIGRRHPDSHHTTRGNINYVAPDDDINYTVMGMMVLEQHGFAFTQRQLADLWFRNLPLGYTFGPERMTLLKMGAESLADGASPGHIDGPAEWTQSWNPRDEACGAAIRVDAYGYACPGRPQQAAELAWRDSSMTHRRTGIYASMYIAAAIAAAFTAGSPLEIFETAQKYVPQKSRFFEIVSDSLNMVRGAGDWLSGYKLINDKYGQYRHCQIYQETALLINTAKFAKNTDEAICMQVASGCDTDCYGEIIGSIMGAYYGPEGLNEKWLAPFNDRLHTALANFHEQSLSKVADRMARLRGQASA